MRPVRGRVHLGNSSCQFCRHKTTANKPRVEKIQRESDEIDHSLSSLSIREQPQGRLIGSITGFSQMTEQAAASIRCSPTHVRPITSYNQSYKVLFFPCNYIDGLAMNWHHYEVQSLTISHLESHMVFHPRFPASSGVPRFHSAAGQSSGLVGGLHESPTRRSMNAR